MIFGVFLLLAGAMVLMGAISALLAPLLPSQPGVVVPSRTMMLSSLFSSLLMGTALIWLGIGSIQMRRWARAILLCLGWIGLIAGLMSLTMIGSMLGSLEVALRQQAQPLPATIIVMMKAFMVAVMVGMYVAAPAALILFYRSPHVKTTCEQRDPVPRWTDRCPLPVLAFSLLQGYGAVSMLAMLPSFGFAFPLAGRLVTGTPSYVLWLGCIALSAYAAIGFYRLSLRAWWIYAAGMLILGSSALFTFTRIDLLAYYRAVGFSAEDLSLLAQQPITQSHALIWMSAGGCVLLFGGLLWVKRFFGPTAVH